MKMQSLFPMDVQSIFKSSTLENSLEIQNLKIRLKATNDEQ